MSQFYFFIYIFLLFFPLACSQEPVAQKDISVSANEAILKAFHEKQSGITVESAGNVLRILDDDIQIPRHQRFIVRLSSGQTLLIAHNIDVAPRVENVKAGDTITFRGQYEWNEKGGLVHWTHHDPQNKHVDGFIEHEGKKYF